MKRFCAVAVMFAGVAVLFTFGACGGRSSQAVDGGPDSGPDAGPGPYIEFMQPKNGQLLTTADGEDPSTEGIKYDVKVAVERVESGQLVALTDSADIDPGTGQPRVYREAVTIDDSGAGSAVFPSFLFQNGEHTLTASVSNKAGASASHTVTVTADDVVSCAITQPVEGQTLTEADNTKPGDPEFHYNVAASCHQIETDNDVHLHVNGVKVATAKIQAGLVVFADAVLAEGANVITLVARNSAGRQASVTPVNVTVNTGRCLARINMPWDGALYLENPGGPNVIVDADLVTPGMQANLEFETAYDQFNKSCSTNATVSWTITTPYFEIYRNSAVTEEGGKYKAKLYLSLDDPINLLDGKPVVIKARVDQGGTEKKFGVALPSNVTVDSVLPSGAITMPTDGMKYNASMNSNPNLPGFHIDVKGATGRVPVKEKVILIVDKGPAQREVVLGSNALDLWDSPNKGDFRFKDVEVEGGIHTLTLHVVDAWGNIFEAAPVTVNIDPEVPVIQFVWPSKGQLLVEAHDADMDPGLQIDQTVAGPNKFTMQVLHVEEGQIGELQVGGGTNYRFIISGGEAVFNYPEGNLDKGKYVTLPEGAHVALTAAVRNSAGLMAGQVPSDMWVLVDVTRPVIGFTSPQNHDVVTTGAIDVNLYTVKTEDGQEASLYVCNADGTVCSSPLKAAVASGKVKYLSVALETDPLKQPNLLKAEVHDSAGNPSIPAGVLVTVDAVAPTLQFLKPLEGQVLTQADNLNPDLKNGFAFNVEASAASVPPGKFAYLTVTDKYTGKTGAAIKSNPGMSIAGGSKFTWPAAALPEGDLALKAEYTSPSGGKYSATVNASVSTGRYKVSISDPADGSWLNASKNKDPGSGKFKVDVTASTSAPQSTACVLTITNSGTTTANAAVGTGGQVFFPYASVILEEGPNTLRVRCGDVNTQWGDSAPALVTVDTQVPVVSFVDPVNGQKFNASFHSVAPGPGFFIDVLVQGGTGGGAVPDGATGTLAVTTQSGQTNNYSALFGGNQATFKKAKVSTLDAPAGENPVLKLKASDQAGNQSAEVSIQILVDVVPPTVAVLFPTKTALTFDDDENYAKEDLQTHFTVRLTGATPGRKLYLEITGVTTYSANLDITASNQDLVFSPVDLKEGKSDVRIWTDDEAGNLADTGKVSYTYETPPVLKLLDKNAAAMNAGQSYLWNTKYDTSAAVGFQTDMYVTALGLKRESEVKLCSDNADPGAQLCSFGGGSYRVLATGTVIPVPGQVFGQVKISAIPMNQGNHNVFAESQDDLGNKAQSGTSIVKVDSVPPELVSISLDSGNPSKKKGADWLLGVAEDADGTAQGMQAAFTVTVNGVEDGQTLKLLDHGILLLGSVPVGGGQAVFSQVKGNLVTLADGTHSFTAWTSDLAGNETVLSPTVTAISYIKPPSLQFLRPAEFKNGNWLTMAVCAANPAYACSYNGSVLALNAAVTYRHDNPGALLGGLISLTGGVISPVNYNVSGYTGGDATASFNSFMLAQGVNNLAANIKDAVLNEFTTLREVDVDTLAPTVVFVRPNTPDPASPRLFTKDDNKNPDPSQGLATDQFILSITGVSGTTSVYIESRPKGSSGPFAPILNGTTSVSADNTSLAFASPPYPTLNQGEWELRIRAVNPRGNVGISGSIYVRVEISAPTVVIKKKGGETLASGGKFNISDMDSGPTPFKTTILVASDQEGQPAKLWVNDAAQADQTITSGQATFTGVTLTTYVPGNPATLNKLQAQVTNPVSGYSTTLTLTGIVADGVVPTVAFTYPTTLGSPSQPAKIYKSANDMDGNGKNGLQFLVTPDESIKISTSGVEDGLTAALTCTAGSFTRTDSALVASNAAIFDFGYTEDPSKALVTAHEPYKCTVDVFDFVGNKAVSPELYIYVDVSPPDSVRPSACIGSSTGTGAGESEDPVCGSACITLKCKPGDYDAAQCTCSRRRGIATVAWLAAGEDYNGNGKVKSYEVRWDNDLSALHDCTGFNWAAAKTAGITQSAVVDPGSLQTAVVRGLPPHKYYCFAVKSVDSVDNESSVNAAYAGARRVPFIQEKVADGNGGNYGFGGINVVEQCDYNGDGYADAAVGAQASDSNRGAVFVYYGNKALQNAILNGTTTGGYFGSAVVCGDFNGDGYDDLMASAPNHDNNRGRIGIYFGRANGLNTTPTITMTGPFPLPSGARIGTRLSRNKVNLNGDKNGSRPLDDMVYSYREWDALNDRYISSVRVFKGRADWTGVTTLDPSSPDIQFTPPYTTSSSWSSISGDDFDGDGYDDLAIGVSAMKDGSNGSVFVLFGSASISGVINYNAAGVLRKNGESAGFGRYTTSGAVHASNASDFFVLDTTAPRNVYPFAGRSLDKSDVDAKAKFTNSGTPNFGYSMATVNFDGVSRGLLAGSQGAVYLYYSAVLDFSGGPLTILAGSGNFGYGLDGGGDWDKDGFEDFAVVDSSGNGVLYVYK